MWHVSECEPKSFSDPNNRFLDFIDELQYTVSVSTLTRDWYFIINTSICTLFGHFSSTTAFQRSWQTYVYICSAVTSPQPLGLIVSHFLLHWSQWAHTDNPPLPHISIHKCASNTRMHNSTEREKKADVDKLNGSTVNVVREHQHLRAYTVLACVYAPCNEECI